MDVQPMTPITVVRVLQNVPLDNSYTDTLDFANVSAQSNYFIGKTKFIYSNLTPIRLQNAIRLPVVADKLYNCNYIMFQNANFSNKWFYAFITSIDFVNTNECQINFQIDAWQTWQFDIVIHPSFIEREHANTDAIGDNLVPENLELGDYVSDDVTPTGHLNNYAIVCACSFTSGGVEAEGAMYGGIYSGLEYFVFANAEDTNAFIKAVVGANKASGILCIFMMPADFVANAGENVKAYTVNKDKRLTDVGGYIPKNKKLFTYPYNFLYVSNSLGNGAEYHYEYFATDNCTFGLVGDMSCNPSVVLYPTQYKGVGTNYNEKMAIDGFPQCAYTVDTFRAWLAQNGASTAVSVIGTALATAATGGIAAVAGGAISIAGALAKTAETYSLPPQAHGSQGSGASVATRMKDFYFYYMHIRGEFAQIIDEYFSAYGYATHKVKVPNITGRPSWNYVKTIEAKITGSVPFNDIVTIKNMFNTGVTFWHGDWVGDYTRANEV